MPTGSRESAESALASSGGLLDASDWPLVRARYPGLDEPARMERWLAGIDSCLARGAPFVLIVALPDHDEAAEAPADRKMAALWFKQRRESLAAYCRGFVYVVQDAARRAAMQARADQMAHAFPVAIRVATSQGEAEKSAPLLLDGRTR